MDEVSPDDLKWLERRGFKVDREPVIYEDGPVLYYIDEVPYTSEQIEHYKKYGTWVEDDD